MASRRFFPPTLPAIQTERLLLKLPDPTQARVMLAFRVENRDFLEPWEPLRPLDFYTGGFWRLQLQRNLMEFREGSSLCLALMDHEETEVLGVCNYTNIVRGTFQACHLGYALAEKHQGQGLMYEALEAANRYVFEELRLHRIMANYLPRNDRSGKLLDRLGFRVEGKAEKLLKINGEWEDHILTAKVNPADQD